MIKDFEYYLSEKMVAKQKPNPKEAESLLKKAEERYNFISKIAITSKNASFIFEDVYEVVRESSQALMSIKGYKPYSHEATIAFLKRFYKFDQATLSTFNRYRIIRNNLVYRGQDISKEQVSKALVFAKKFLNKVKRVTQKKD